MSLSFERPVQTTMPAHRLGLRDEATRLLSEVLRTGTELAIAARDTRDVDVANFSLRAAHRLYETASQVLMREDLDESDARQLRTQAERLRELITTVA